MSTIATDIRELDERVCHLLNLATVVSAQPSSLDEEIRRQVISVRDDLVSHELAAIQVDDLEELATADVRMTLSQSGFLTADQLARVGSPEALTAIGISEPDADEVLTKVRDLRRAVTEGLVIQLDHVSRPASHTRLLQTAWKLSAADEELAEAQTKVDWLLRELPPLQAAAVAPGRHGLLGRPSRSDKENAAAASTRLQAVLDDPWTRDAEARLSATASQLSLPPPTADEVWEDYVRREAEYVSWLRELAAGPSGDEQLHLLTPVRGDPRTRADPKILLTQAEESLELARSVQDAPDTFLEQVRNRLGIVRDQLVSAELQAIAVRDASDVVDAQFLRRLESAGIRTFHGLLTLDESPDDRLMAQAQPAIALARQTRDLIRERLGIRLDPVVRSGRETQLLESCALYTRAQQNATELRADIDTFSQTMQTAIDEAAPAASRVKMFLSTPARRGHATHALRGLQDWLESGELRVLIERLSSAAAVTESPAPDADELWTHYQRHEPQFVEWFRQLADPPLSVAADLEVIPLALSTRAATRSRAQVIADAQGVVDRSDEVLGAWSKLQEGVVPQFEAVRQDLVEQQLARIPTERLRETTGGHLVLAPIAKAGYNTVLHLLKTRRTQLEAIIGVGDQTAIKAIAAARQLASVIEADIAVRLDPDERHESQTVLLSTLWLLRQADRLRLELEEPIQRLVEPMRTTVLEAAPAASRLSLFSADATRIAPNEEAYARVEQWIDEPAVQELSRALQDGVTVLKEGPGTDELWRDYERSASDYYALLGELADLSLDVDAAHGYVPNEVAEKVNSLHLDDSFLDVSLRGYQTFGAKFALVQRQAILGDEMGLGKTIEALAAMAHLASIGGTHFLTVCPVSVLFNWMLEIRRRTKLECVQLYGPERDRLFKRWLDRGGVGVTSYGSLGAITPSSDVRPAMLVADEAHYVKNPEALRTRRLLPWIAVADRTLFLTGTPLENRLEEFRNLVTYLLPDPPESIMGAHVVAGASTFRKAVSPVYLRRNQSDVLTELPERLAVDDWIELAGESGKAYASAVASGKFMDMRRAAYDVEKADGSDKLRRLLDIVEESKENGWKVVIFSYFHRVLNAVKEALGGDVFGPLTGATPAEARQQLVDDFSAVDGHAVMVAQVEAGGTGLNMQAASVVVLTEPQVKPTLEEQAIARCHRMGQVRRVHVHRLLARNTVDERMLEILAEKKRIFDEYVRDSALKEATPDSIDISHVDVARMVAAEQERLGLAHTEVDSAAIDDGDSDRS